MILNRKNHENFLRLASNIYDNVIASPKYSDNSRFRDQTSLNIAAQWQDMNVFLAPRQYNWVQESEKWMREGYPVIGAHKPKRKLPKETASDLEKWMEFFAKPPPEHKYPVIYKDYADYSGIYEVSYTNDNTRRIEFLTDGTVVSHSYHESWWIPVRNSDGCMHIHVLGTHDHVRRRLLEVRMFAGVPAEGSYNEWVGTSELESHKQVNLRKLT
jgi:hypothetical protein